MGFPRLLANESLIGIDIGSSNIKIVHAEMTKHGSRITHVVSCPTPLDAVKEGVIVSIPDVASAIQFAMRSAGIKGTSTVTAVSGPGVIVRNVQLPKMSEQVLRKSIRFEAGKYISASIDDSIVEFDILGDAEDGQMNVVLVAAPREMIDSRAITLEQAGLDPLSIDIEAFATLRVLVENSPDSSLMGNTIAMLDMGASHTEINLVSNGNMMLTRTIPISGTSLTHAIRSVESCSEEDAEQSKYALDLTPLVDPSGGSASSSSLRAVQQLVDELLREIRRSINYYQSQLPEGSSDTVIEKIILSGGAARLKGLLPYTRSRLNVDVALGNPVPGIPGASSSSIDGLNEEDFPLFSVALGLIAKEMPAIHRGVKEVVHS
ncbi:MAG: type IV pilus assembly protein PilM [Armatimonadota bacterium]